MTIDRLREVRDRLSLLSDALAEVRLRWPGNMQQQALVTGILAREGRNLAAYLGKDDHAAQWDALAVEYGDVHGRCADG